MTRKYERTFHVGVPVERAWKAFTDPDDLRAWFTPTTEATEARTGEAMSFDAFGLVDFDIQVKEIQPGRLLRYSQGPGVTPGATDFTVVFEATDAGTRITITQEGFGEGDEWLESLQGVTMGINETIADLILYLETGVSFMRHGPSNAFAGFAALNEPAGLRVYDVLAGSGAGEAGLEPGDIVLKIGRCPVFDRRDVEIFIREREPGDAAELVWVREGKVIQGRGELSDRRTLVGVAGRGPLRWI